MKELLIRHILGWLVGLTAAQWQAALQRVAAIAATPGLAGPDKAEKFNKFFSALAANLPPWAINLVREMAVAWLRRKGLIK